MVLARLFFLFLSTVATVPVCADVSGLEHLSHISVDCGKVERAKPEEVDGIQLCSYSGVLCKVTDKSEFLLEAAITADCRAEGKECPEIDECAKKKLSGPAVDAVRRRNDPNYSRPDGHVDVVPSQPATKNRESVK